VREQSEGFAESEQGCDSKLALPGILVILVIVTAVNGIYARSVV